MTQTPKYPWNEVPDGGYFFVPAVNAQRVREEGILAAAECGVKYRSQIGIYDGQYGVIFRRVGTLRAPY